MNEECETRSILHRTEVALKKKSGAFYGYESPPPSADFFIIVARQSRGVNFTLAVYNVGSRWSTRLGLRLIGGVSRESRLVAFWSYSAALAAVKRVPTLADSLYKIVRCRTIPGRGARNRAKMIQTKREKRQTNFVGTGVRRVKLV